MPYSSNRSIARVENLSVVLHFPVVVHSNHSLLTSVEVEKGHILLLWSKVVLELGGLIFVELVRPIDHIFILELIAIVH